MPSGIPKRQPYLLDTFSGKAHETPEVLNKMRAWINGNVRYGYELHTLLETGSGTTVFYTVVLRLQAIVPDSP